MCDLGLIVLEGRSDSIIITISLLPTRKMVLTLGGVIHHATEATYTPLIIPLLLFLLQIDHLGGCCALIQMITVCIVHQSATTPQHELVQSGVALTWRHLQMWLNSHTSYFGSSGPWHDRSWRLLALLLDQIKPLLSALLDWTHRCRRSIVTGIHTHQQLLPALNRSTKHPTGR